MTIGGIKQFISVSVYKITYTLGAWADVFLSLCLNQLINLLCACYALGTREIQAQLKHSSSRCGAALESTSRHMT